MSQESLQREAPDDSAIAARYNESSSLSGQRVIPNNLYAEQALLGAILIDNTQFDRITGYLDTSDFYQQKHQAIFDAFSKLLEKSENVDLVTTRTALEQSGDLEKAGGIEYLLELANETPYAGNIESYAKIVHDCGLLRRLLRCTHDIRQMVLDSGESPATEVLSKSQHLIYEIDKEEKSNVGLTPFKDSASEAFKKIEDLFENPSSEGATGVPSGFVELDNMTLGFQPSDLIIIAGRPSMGKTALALNIAEYAAIQKKLRVAIFSLEMSGVSLATRSLSSLSTIDSKRIRDGKLGVGAEADSAWQRLAVAYDLLNDAQIYIDDTSGLSPIEISARARRMKRERGGLDLVIVDYLQLLQMQSKVENRVHEIAGITRELKFLAKELEIPVICLSQLNRAAENRNRPIMADLRDSGAIEQDADLVLFIYRDEVYNPKTKDQNMAEIIVAKHRNGETGTVKLWFVKECTRFETPAKADYDYE